MGGCSIKHPDYHPRFEQFSDEDLNALEVVATLFGFDTALSSDAVCNLVRFFLLWIPDFCCQPERIRRERLIAAFGDPADTGLTDAQVWTMVRAVQRCTTPDQVQCLLDYVRYWFTVEALQCLDAEELPT